MLTQPSLCYKYVDYGSCDRFLSLQTSFKKPTFARLLFPMSSLSKFGANIRQNIVRVSRTAFQDLKRDVKSIRWLRGLGWFVGMVWLFGLLTCIALLGNQGFFVSENTACQPDGSFRLQPDTYSMWSSTGFFQITIGGGNLTFAQAKLIDIVWDIVSRSGN